MMYKLFLMFSLAFVCYACDNEEKEDVTQTVDKTGAIETVLSTEHIDDANDVLITSYKVWAKGTLVREIVRRDTVPSLGDFSETDEQGKRVQGKKDYELYITVK
jgi:hypothetical protein